MTICDLRKAFPHSEFYFFKDGREMQKAPFYHDKVKTVEIKNGGKQLFIHM